MSNLPDMQPVTSSMLTEAGYNAESQTLYVRFKGGKLYRYFGVPMAHWRGMMAADSCGQYLNANIKPNYQFEQVA